MNNTYIQTPHYQPKWYLIDASRQNLGRLSTYIATLLKGKNNSTYTPYVNPKVYIIIVNAKDINITGQKKYQKVYRRHSGKPGELKTESFIHLNKRIPSRIIENCIKGMLPKGNLGRELFRQLKVYSDHNHPHSVQKPEIIILN
uniref:ribosomal protein L13 n=1 Tax=Catenella fusiformis TaxID=3024791 RepID=UPI0027DA38A2|nr:ribosomal protein L13 [Catenella fusiformis]WCH57582.1 ribosomal protein L13 [Catenella fusiformis]